MSMADVMVMKKKSVVMEMKFMLQVDEERGNEW